MFAGVVKGLVQFVEMETHTCWEGSCTWQGGGVFALGIAAAHLVLFMFLYNIFSIEGRNECHLAYSE